MLAIYGPTFMLTPMTFEKVLMDPIRPNMFKKCGKNAKKKLNPFLGHFQKSETGSKSLCRSILASSFQKWSSKVF